MPSTFRRIAIFDLDGTLTDSLSGIRSSISHAMSSRGYRAPSTEEVCAVIGPPLHEATALLGVRDEDLDDVVDRYREHYRSVGLYENEVIAGVPELLRHLSTSGVTLAVATSKIQPWAVEVLDYFDLSQYFEIVAGADLDGTRAEKAAVITDCLNQLLVDDDDHAIMIGDRLHDVQGAADNKIGCVGVSWGYAPDGELAAAGALAIVSTAEELGQTLEEIWFRGR